MRRSLAAAAIASLLLFGCATGAPREDGRRGLVGYWPLRGDAQDHSGRGNHGRNRGVDLETASFTGRDGFIEVPHAPSLEFGSGDFTFTAWVWTGRGHEDVLGDVLCKFDPAKRKGITLTLKASSGGYNSQGDDRHAIFGIDDGRTSEWEDGGRPSPTSNYVSNSLTVFDGHLYAGITDAAKEEDWCHVFRTRSGKDWEDCGRVGSLRTRGVGPLIVHDSRLYAATWSYDWNRVTPDLDFCRVYRYAGGREWEDCGPPGRSRRLFGMASFKGRLYVVGEDRTCYVHEGGQEWKAVGTFPNYGHPMGVHDGRMFVGVLNPAGVHAYDGATWARLGNPYVTEKRCNQIHALEVFRGRLFATTWPEGLVSMLGPDDRWIDCGRPGDSIEINGLTVYNGKLYCGTIPRAEVFRYEGGKDWTSLKRFLEPADLVFRKPEEWARVTSLTVFAGRLFASLGSCTSSILDAPCDFRGKVYSMEAGKCVSYDRDLGPGWKHLAAVRRGGRLELHVDGKLEAVSSAFAPGDYELSNTEPLRIGSGETGAFNGRILEVRAYARALDPAEIAEIKESDSRKGLP